MLPQIAFWLPSSPSYYLLPMSKRKLDTSNDEIPDPFLFRQDMADLMLSNTISFTRGQRVLKNAIASGSQNVSDLASAGCKGKWKGNISRDTLRKLLKRNKWPPLYFADVTVHDPASLTTKRMPMPFWLPHEIVFCLEAHSLDPTSLKRIDDLEVKAKSHFVSCCNATHVSPDSAYAIGFWFDGVPFNNDRSKSMEIGSFCLPGLCSNLRIPLFLLPKDFCLDATWLSISEILKWSMDCLASGMMPTQRHDGSIWTSADSKRSRWAAKDIPRGFAVQLRGDWACFKQVFQLAGWQEKAGCCFRCSITTDHLGQCGARAPWKEPANRLTHADTMLRIWKKGQVVSHFWGMPFFHTGLVCIDWLHTCDLGVSPLFLGSLFTLVLERIGGDKQEALQVLWQKMKAFYKETSCESRLNTLKLSMLKGKNCPKLRAKAGECRALVPFGQQMAFEFLNDGPEDAAAKLCSSLLAQCYEHLAVSTFNKQKLLKTADSFCLQYSALFQWALDHGINRWPIKPKFHLMQEMIFEAEDALSKTWTYQDESWGGLMASAAKRRGGKYSLIAFGKSSLLRFAAQNDIPHAP